MTASTLFRKLRSRYRTASRSERTAWIAGAVATSPVTVPVFLGFWAQRQLLRKLKGRPRFVSSTARPPAVAPDPRVEAELAAEPDTFALVRVIGNDLPPRHSVGQSRENLEFVLENEPHFDGCEKLWIVNRIIDAEEEAKIIARLEEAGQSYEVIPFVPEDYARVPLDFSLFGQGQFLLSNQFGRLSDEQRDRALAQIHRLRNAYVMHNNGARNHAIELGRTRAKWVLPFDGNCFLTTADWDLIRRDVAAAGDRQYLVVPMARLGTNDAALDRMDPKEAVEEPQIIFRRDAPERFDEAHPYGRRPKVELFARLGIKGPWRRWLNDPWDLATGPVSAGAHRVGRAGMVRRLASGRVDLETHGRGALHSRGVARCAAIVARLADADRIVLETRGYTPGRPIFFDRDRLAALGADRSHPLARALQEAAATAMARGPYSVTHKTELPPSGNPNDYFHPAPYWWPNPNSADGQPYIKRDGERLPGTEMYSPESEKFDRTRYQMLGEDVLATALAWTAFGDARARGHAIGLVRTWFLDAETAMTPHLRQAQVRRGHNNDEGSSTGLIEFKDLAFILDGVRLVDDPDLTAGLKEWLRPYADWMLGSAQGRRERRAKNNHGLYFDIQFAAIAAFLGDIDRLLDSYMHSVSRIDGHFDKAGAQPHELERTLTKHYCAFNLQGWLTLLQLYRGCGLPIDAQPELASVARGVTWFLDYRGRDWPYEQIAPFDEERFVPVSFCAAELGIGPDPLPEDRGVAQARPLFHPHDGVPPFWSIMLPNLMPPSDSKAAA